jgi:hypothetical protein
LARKTELAAIALRTAPRTSHAMVWRPSQIVLVAPEFVRYFQPR